MSHDPWRYTCPNGHNAWRANVSAGYYCQSCGAAFDELVDAKRQTVSRPPNTGEPRRGETA